MNFWKEIKRLFVNSYFNWALVILYAGLIFYVSHQPGVPIIEGTLLETFFNYSIKIGLAHFIEYAILSLLLFRALYVSKVRNAVVYSAIISIIYGATDEFHQLFVPNRFFDLMDLFFDSLGAIFASLMTRSKFFKFLKKR